MQATINIGDISLDGAWYGPKPPDSPTIVMMHEGLGSVSTWRNFLERVAEATKAGVFAFSRAGYGRSSPASLPRPIDYLQREAVDVLPKVLDAIGFQRGILLGHSDGGSIAAIYAGSIQDHRVRGLVLIEPHFFVEEMNIDAIRKTARDYETTDFRTRLARHHANADDTFRGWRDLWLDPRFKSFDIREELNYIRVPVLIVKGADDPYSTVAQIRVAENECYCPVESVVIPNARHAPHHDQPELTLEAISSFINHILWFHQEAGHSTHPLRMNSARNTSGNETKKGRQ
jgi:pimeloyl-ACP methyl ester carboxylesterase